MKPMNFPGRKLQRQKDALARMKKGSASPRRRKPTNPRNEAARATELQTLAGLARMPDTQARAIRTKKDRTHRAKLGRAA